MDEIFGSKWSKSRGQSAIDVNGQLTSVARTWSDGLVGIDRQGYVDGFKYLVDNHSGFAPDLIEFRNYCTGNETEEVMDAIMCRLQQGDKYEWKNQLAFNFWKTYTFDLVNLSTYNIPKLIKQNLKMIDKTSMFPLPDYTQKAIEKPIKEIKKEHDPIWKRALRQAAKSYYPELKINLKKYTEIVSNRPDQLLSEFKNQNGFTRIIPELKKSNKGMRLAWLDDCAMCLQKFLIDKGLLS